MQVQILENTDAYQIGRHGNGIAYSMTRKADGATWFVQGDDAIAVENAYENISQSYESRGTTYYQMNWNDCLKAIWETMAD